MDFLLLLDNFKSYTNKEIDWSLVEIDEVEVNKNGQIYSPLKDSDIYPIFIKDKEKYFKRIRGDTRILMKVCIFGRFFYIPF